MKTHLMYPDRDFDLTPSLPDHERDLVEDLSLDTLLNSMADGDQFLLDVARKALAFGQQSDLETIRYRQAVVRDCMSHPEVVREIYGFTLQAIEGRKKSYWSFYGTSPGAILHGSIEVLKMFMGILLKLRRLTEAHVEGFDSTAFVTLFAMLQSEFDDAYLARVDKHLVELKFPGGVLLSAALGVGNETTRIMLHPEQNKKPSWIKRLFGKSPPAYTFSIADRDDAGAKAVSVLRDKGINEVANALVQSMDHILGFFEMIRGELAFYIGSLNLYKHLVQLGSTVAFPDPVPLGGRVLHFTALYDPCLALSMGHTVVSNTINADGNSLMIITGANQGGKSSFLRSIGVAQLMMQCGLFVAADEFAGSLCSGIFTHYTREEDAGMRSGKLDEELDRMSMLVNNLHPEAIVLFNESFASTNEREGSEIAAQIVRALLDRKIKVIFVTHLYDFAHGLYEEKATDALFLRAERHEDGTRTFRLSAGEPLQTSYGEDLYKLIFEPAEANVAA